MYRLKKRAAPESTTRSIDSTDTKTTREMLEGRFGGYSAGLVAGVTEQKFANGQKVPWEGRKQQQLEHLRNADLDMVRLKAAADAHNAQSVLRDLQVIGEKVWDRFNRPKEFQLKYFQEVAEIVHDRLGDEPLALELLDAVAALVRVGGGSQG